MNYTKKDIIVIMPCKNEADNLDASLRQLKNIGLNTIVVGMDPGTTDASPEIAKKLGCDVVMSPRSGYDYPMHTATNYALKSYPKRPLLYTDAGGKFSLDAIDEMLIELSNEKQIVLGNRIDTVRAMSWHQKAGTQLIVFLINRTYKVKLVDISPFRLVSFELFEHISMQPKKFRWTTEMLVKALACNILIGEVDIQSRKRLGSSKISGTLKNSLLAGVEMLSSFKFVKYKGVKND